MKKEYIVYAITAILTIATFVTVIKVRKNNIQDKIEVVSEKQVIDELYSFFRHRNKDVIANNGIKLNFDLQIEDQNQKRMSIGDLFINSSSPFKLIISSSSLGCDICIREELMILESYIDKIGHENIIIFASDYNQRALMILKENLKCDLKIYQIERINIPFEEKSNNLFIFVLDENFIIKDFFIPEKSLPELSKDYYEAICNKHL